MDQNKKQELELKLAKYRDLARQYTDGISAKNIQQATESLEKEIRDLEK
jgi:hypothetical protein